MGSKSVQQFEEYVIQQRNFGRRVSLYDMIEEYMLHMQRTTDYMIREYIYRKIGEDWRSPEFDAKIKQTIERIFRRHEMDFDGEYYAVQ